MTKEQKEHTKKCEEREQRREQIEKELLKMLTMQNKILFRMEWIFLHIDINKIEALIPENIKLKD